jgi:hypothetical protein
MPAIKYFETARDVIEGNLGGIAAQRGITREDALEDIKRHLVNNTKEWRSGRQPNIPYNDPLCRMAYLYGIAAANASQIEDVISQSPSLQEYIDNVQREKGHVEICSFGGGPGTELLGLAKWAELRGARDQLAVDFLVLDRVNEWLDSWQAIKRNIDKKFRENFGANRNAWPLVCSGSFSSVDITRTENVGNWGNIFGQDIYIMCYIISEVFDDVEDLRSFTNNMASHAPAGSKFIFVDRNEQRWKDEVKLMADNAGIELSDFHVTNSTMDPYTEDKTDLGKIFEEVGRNPRVRWSSFWVVGTKV